MVEILKQPQYKPMDVIDQVMVIYAATKGYMDDVPIKQVRAWEEQFLTFMKEQKSPVRNDLKKSGKMSPEIERPAEVGDRSVRDAVPGEIGRSRLAAAPKAQGRPSLGDDCRHESPFAVEMTDRRLKNLRTSDRATAVSDWRR